MVRAHSAFARIVSSGGESLTRIAQEYDYYDQSHFVRSMHGIFGASHVQGG